MIRLSKSDSFQISSVNNTYGPHMGTQINITGNDDGDVTLICNDVFGKFIKQINIGDMVHVNITQFSDYQKEIEKNGIQSSNTIWNELRQFEVIEMKAIHESGYYAIECDVILKERDRKNPANDGTYWIFFAKGTPGTSLTKYIYLGRIGNELTEQDIKYAKEHAASERAIYIFPLAMAPSEYVQECWEAMIKNKYYNKTFGKGMLLTSDAFPDSDKESENELSSGNVFLGILWGFIPEGTIGFTYLILALFFSACVCVMDTGWLIIIFIVIIYWGKNVSLKTNKRW